jgi:pyroglutamyl-peptidase
MSSVLLTAFDPYDDWAENASWLALAEFVRQMPEEPRITTRRYPVDFDELPERLSDDLALGFDYAVHLGQSPRDAVVTLEKIGINIRGERGLPAEAFGPLSAEGPAAYQSSLPLDRIAARLRDAGIPVQVSHHAGTFLCNAALYLSHHIAAGLNQPTRAMFVHLPLSPGQVNGGANLPSLPTSTSARAVRLILEELK